MFCIIYFKRSFNSLHKFLSFFFPLCLCLLRFHLFKMCYFSSSYTSWFLLNVSVQRTFCLTCTIDLVTSFISLVLFLKFPSRTHVSCLICHSRMTDVGGDSSLFHCFSELLTFTQNMNKSSRRSLLKIALLELKEAFSFKVYFLFFFFFQYHCASRI